MRLAAFALATLPSAALLGACSPISSPTNTSLFLISTIDTAVGSTAQTSLGVDATGRVHVAYSQDGISNLRYATCAADCAESASWSHTTVDTTSNSGLFNSFSAAAGALHIVYQVYSGQGKLRYATCSANCLLTASWQTVTIDSAGNTGHDGSLAVGPAGQLHVTYLESVAVPGGRWRLKYATCTASCTDPAGWSSAILDSAVFVDASSRALALDGSGRLHLVYQKTDSIGQTPVVYATCTASCANAANWVLTGLDTDPLDHAAPVVAVDALGVPSVAYWGKLGGLATINYALCAGVCTTSVGWNILPIQTLESGTSDLDQHSLVLDAASRPQMSFQHGGLSYAGCVSSCTAPGAWLEFLVDPGVGGVGSSVGGLSGGGVGIAYVSPTSVGGRLKFAVSN
jgi:hypothetical protein